MVKKKGHSKRTSLGDKYKIKRRTAETHRKRRKQARREGGKKIKPKDPGIPNAWPFKQELLREIQRTKEKEQDRLQQQKEKRRTVADLARQAAADQAAYAEKTEDNEGAESPQEKRFGQQSRRAYLRELKKVVDGSDVLLQVLDARDPLAYTALHPTIDDIVHTTDKRLVYVLNKIDLVPKSVVQEWLTYLRRKRPTVAVKACLSRSNESKSTDNEEASGGIVGMDGLLQLLKNYARTGGPSKNKKSNKTTIVVGIIGYPNVGKSSIINSLKRSRAVGVSPRPGFTTSMQEVVLDKTVRLLDSPGVVFNDQAAVLGNCVDSTALLENMDPIPPVTALLQRCNHESLLMTYNIPNFPVGDAAIFLALVAKTYGRVLKGGVPDKVTAAKMILKDWNSGKIPFYTKPPVGGHDIAEDAVVVSDFGKEFDVAALDNAVMDLLEEKDEMDFVKLETSDDTSSGMVVDGDDDEDGDVGNKGKKKRRTLASAEDYDFDDMC